MPTKTETLIKLIDDAIINFNSGLPASQNKLYDELNLILKDLEIENGKLKNSVANIRMLGKLKNKINEVIVNDKYKNDVAKYISQFNAVSDWHDKYFSELVKKYKTPKVLEAIKVETIDATVTAMTDTGIDSNIGEGIRSILRTAITSGGSYSSLTEDLRTYIKGNDKIEGAMQRYLKTIATDSINTYSATYNDNVSMDLGLNWFRFTGSLLETSRPCCIEMEKYEYFHRKQIPDILKGKIYNDTVPLYAKTDLPEGFKANTTVANYPQLRNGWNCGHQIIWISDGQVPDSVKIKVKALGYSI